MYSKTFPLLMMYWLCACTHFERSIESGYSHGGTKSTKSGWKKIESDQILTKSFLKESPTFDQQFQIQQLENALATRKELEQYSRVLPWLKNDEEKLEFLQLRSLESKQQWILENDLQGRSQRIKQQLNELVEKQDIALGMPEELVKKSWGEPQSIDTSGNPLLRNQRWRYQKYISTDSGYKNEKKYVYFEGGRVTGWEVE